MSCAENHSDLLGVYYSFHLASVYKDRIPVPSSWPGGKPGRAGPTSWATKERNGMFRSVRGGRDRWSRAWESLPEPRSTVTFRSREQESKEDPRRTRVWEKGKEEQEIGGWISQEVVQLPGAADLLLLNVRSLLEVLSMGCFTSFEVPKCLGTAFQRV